MVNYNTYDFGQEADDDRLYPKNFNFFTSIQLYDVMNLNSDNLTTGRGEYQKPIFYSEAGSPKTWQCDTENVELQREIYQSMFSGLAGFLHWEIQRKNLYFDFRPLASFFANIDLEGLKYHSGFTKLDNGEWTVEQNYIDDAISNDLDVDLVYLRSKDKNSAIGVITNRTYNYQTVGGCNSQNGGDASYYYSATDDEQVKQGGSQTYIVDDFGSRVKLKNMNSGFYDITYYKYDDVNQIISTSSDFGPQVKLEYPQLNLNNWMVLFKAEKRNTKNRSNFNDTLIERENRGIENPLLFSIFPNPTKESFNYSSNSDLLSVAIYNTYGKQVLSKVNVQQRGTIDVSGLSDGIYIVKAILAKGGAIVTLKLIVK